MKFVLDTHVYAWWADGDQRLSRTARDVLENQTAELILSAVVTWELATKFRIGKWPGAGALLDDLDASIRVRGLTPLPISLAHARCAGLLRGDHRDPFDRILVAQAQLERAALLSADPALAAFEVETVW